MRETRERNLELKYTASKTSLVEESEAEGADKL